MIELNLAYEEALKIKYVNGSEDAAMIDLIHDSITSPFALAYNNILGGMLLANCFLTPHIAGSLVNETHRMAEYIIEEYERYINGESCRYEVSLKMLETMA